jgi:glycosyltransferase involved in cell wall biosynthesis
MRSVIGQTFNDFEYIVIDGGSTDGSTEAIKANHNKISKWESQNDKGIYDAMNKGIRLAEGDYCLFINSGDTLASPTILESIFNRNLNSDIFYGNMLIDESGTLRLGIMPDHLTKKQMIRDTLWHPVSFIKRGLFKRVGLYDESLKIVADYDFFLKCIFKFDVKTKHIHETIAVFNMEGLSSLHSNRVFLQTERKKVQLRYFSEEEIESFLHISIFEKIKNRIKSLLK